MLYFVRHGQTNHNLNKLLAGRCDIELNETGIKQAKQTALKYKDLKIDVIYCSPLTRARQTCNIINEEHKCRVIIKEELIERDFGVYESKDYSSVNGELCWNYYQDAYAGEMETLKEVFKRVYKLLDQIKERAIDENILIVAHNDIGRAIHCYFNGIPSDGNLLNLSMPNGEILKYEWNK